MGKKTNEDGIAIRNNKISKPELVNSNKNIINNTYNQPISSNIYGEIINNIINSVTEVRNNKISKPELVNSNKNNINNKNNSNKNIINNANNQLNSSYIYGEIINNIINSVTEVDDNDVIWNSLNNKNYSKLKMILNKINNKNIDVNKIYDGKTIVSTLIDNTVNDEELYNILFKKGAFVDRKYFMNNGKNSFHLIKENQGLIKAIIRHGLLTKKSENSPIKVNKTPLSTFIKSGQDNFAEIFLENNAPVEETDENGFTPIFHAIYC
eukprot:jgi/Orpsp1_1/1187371/evm.model.d7180000057226.1